MSVLKCNPITISNCPDDSSCDACIDIEKAQCVKYFGDNLTFLGITSGANLKDILIAINQKIGELSGVV